MATKSEGIACAKHICAGRRDCDDEVRTALHKDTMNEGAQNFLSNLPTPAAEEGETRSQ